MNSRERVLVALACRVPDVVPFMFSFVDVELQKQILGRKLTEYVFDLSIDPGFILRPGERVDYRLNYMVHPDTARALGLDAVGIRFPIPFFCATRFGRGGHSVERGLLATREALERAVMPSIPDEVLREAERFVRAYRGEFAVFANIRLGAAPTLLSMGYDAFSYALYDNRQLVCDVVDFYADWIAGLVRSIRDIGFDFMWAFDDIAFKSGALFSNQVWREVFLPRLLRVAREIPCPWIYHSDGNLLPILDDLLPLGMSGLHPLEPGTMDLDRLKRQYGRRLCLVGNIDINYTLSRGTPEEVEREVRERIAQLAPGGGYIISDSNSVPYFCRAENILAMSAAVKRHRSAYGKGEV